MVPGLERLVSGGQTGVDRAALDVALDHGIACGGWCPRGRRAEDGTIPARYPLRETAAAHYAQRTALNVRDSEATLILTCGEPDGGTALTIALAQRHERPLHIVRLDAAPDPEATRQWIAAHRIRTLNVAGPRESRQPGIQAQAYRFLRALLLPD